MDTLDSGSMSSNSDVSAQAINSLKGSTPWMKFMAILGFIGAGLMVIAALMMIAAGSQVPNSSLIGVLYIAFAGVYFYVSYLLLQWTNSLSAYVLGRDPMKLEVAFAKQKTWWMTIGILTIAGFALGIIMAVAGVGFMAQSEYRY